MVAGTPLEAIRELIGLFFAEAWSELDAKAREAVERYPETARIYGFIAHAKRQLGELEAGYDWAVRGAARDAADLFVRNRVSLLANLTARYAEAFATAAELVDAPIASGDDARNLAVTIVNGIYAASRLDRVADAVERFSPVIERLDHPELHFNSACLYALAGDERWERYMVRALEIGKPAVAFADGDFDRLRDEPRFRELLARDWGAEAAALARSGKPARAALVPEDFIDPDRCGGGEPSRLRDPAIERAIAEHPDDADGYLVYADWLHDHAEPLGNFVLASRDCDRASTESQRMLAFVAWAEQLHAHAGRWLGDFASYLGRDHAAATWRHGFVRDLAFDLGVDKSPGELDAAALLERTLALPSLRFVRRLEIGDIPRDDEMDYAEIIDVLAGAELPCLRSLAIGPREFQLSHTQLDASALASKLPQLEVLQLGGVVELGALELPRLRRFAIHTVDLTCENLDDLERARWPLLEDLELWFGTGTISGPDELAALLDPRRTPKLRRLALMNALIADELCAWLVREPWVSTLHELDFAMGAMSDAGAAALAGAAPRLAHLSRISIAQNCVSERACAELRRLLPNIEIGDQKYIADRYVGVAE